MSQIRSAAAGFSMVDILVTTTLGILLAGVTLPTVAESVRQARADAAMNAILTNLRLARQLAVDQRRTYRVTFTAPGSVLLEKRESTTGWNSVSVNHLPDRFQFSLTGEAPTDAAASPDGIASGSAVDFGGTQVVYFRPDGTATDLAGDAVQGIVQLAIPGKPTTARAITLFGGTARAKGWRLSEGATRWEWTN